MDNIILGSKSTSVDWKSRIDELKERNVSGAVFYSDGGHRTISFKPRSGYGLHVYFYNEEKAEGLGAFKLDHPTKNGYLPKKQVEKGEAVNIIKILNAYGNIGTRTSQVAELEAFIQAAHIFLDNKLYDFFGVFALRTDSEYVVKGINNNIHIWATNKWRKADGSNLANVTYWKKIYELIGAIEKLGCGLDISWVKAHEVNFGNNTADQMATLGLFQDLEYGDEWVDRSEYMAASLEFSPLLIDSKLLYYPGEENLNMRDGMFYHYAYNSNNNTDKVNEVGRNLVDASISIIATMYEQPALTDIYDHCSVLDEHISKTPKVVDLNLITKPNIQVELRENNLKSLPIIRDKKDIKVNTVGEKTVITVLDPPRNALFTEARLRDLMEVYRRLITGDETVIEKDITEHLFDTEVNGKGVTKYKFKVTEAPSVDVTAPIWKEGGVVDYDFTLTLGLDLPRRRVFSNIKDANPKVSIFTWYENEYVSYFGTIIRIDDAFGVWTAEHSNTVLTGGLQI